MRILFKVTKIWEAKLANVSASAGLAMQSLEIQTCSMLLNEEECRTETL